MTAYKMKSPGLSKKLRRQGRPTSARSKRSSGASRCQPIGRLEVQRVCDGQEIWNRGAAECQQKWQEYLKVFGRQAPAAPWQRTRPRK